MTALISLLFKIAGVGFLIVAAIGVMRFTDAFQRMHAATKAGTLGAGLVIAGTIVNHGSGGAAVMGSLTILFLLLTVPVAGHMLGRASYISGAGMAGLRGENALEGVLERHSKALEERLAELSEPSALGSMLADRDIVSPAPERRNPTDPVPDISEVRLAVIHGQIEAVFPRAVAIAAANNAHLSAHVIVDQAAIDVARDTERARYSIRERAAEAMEALEKLKGNERIKIALNYDEGDPEELLSCDSSTAALLVLPREGWFHHGCNEPRPGMSWGADGLLRLPSAHRGPVLYTCGVAPAKSLVVVRDCGEPHLPEGLDWALRHALWDVSRIVVAGCSDEARMREYAAIAYEHGAACEQAALQGSDLETGALPSNLAGADGLILGTLPPPLRTHWYGQAWYDRLIPGYRGDILVV